MKIIKNGILGILGGAATLALPPGVACAAETKPNIVFILADDLGYGDLGIQGHPDFKTPNLDRLATEGIRLGDFSASAPICSPSRAGFLTGQFPMRHRIISPFQMDRNQTLGQPDWLDPRLPTLPRLLRDNGYTTAIFGKWHLVEEREEVMKDAPKPDGYGFQTWNLMRGPWDSTMQPTQSFDAAVAYLEKPPGEPFFLQVTVHEPHVPYIATLKAMEKFKHLGDRVQRYAASVYDMDVGVGRILAALKEQGLDDNTLVIFTSDNGPARPFAERDAPHMQYWNAGSAGPLRGYKGTLYEGGIRVPFIARWPGRIPAGAVDQTSSVSGVDLLPTLAAAAGVAVPADWSMDGENRLAVLEGKPSSRTGPLFWLADGQRAARKGNYKLVRTLNKKEGAKEELFNLSTDLGEQTDLLSEQPDIAADLRSYLEAREKEMPATADPALISEARNKARKGGGKE